MAFNIGDVEGRLTLDRTPFNEGLDLAKEDVRRFEEERHTVTEHVDVKGLDTAEADLKRLEEEMKARLAVDVDDKKARVKLERIQTELIRLNHERVTPEVDVKTEKADRDIRTANTDIRTLTGSVTRLGAVASVVGRSTMPALIAGLVGLAPALVPLGTVGVGAVAGMSTAFLAAGAAAGVFGLAAKSTLKNVEIAATKTGAAQQRALAALGPGGAQAVAALKVVQGQWQGLQRAVQPYVTQLVRAGAQTLSVLMPTLRSLGVTGGQVFTQLAHQAQTALAGPFWQQFLRFIQGQARPAILAFGGSFGNVAHGMAALTMAFQPLEGRFLSGMGRMTGAFQQWASTLANSRGFHQFMASIQADIPVVMGFLKALGGAAIQLVKALEPVGRAVLAGLTPVFRQLARDMPAIAPGFAALGRFAVALLRNIESLIPPIARLLVLLEPLATVLVNALGTALRGLEPALAALIRGLTPVAQTLFPALARVIAGIAPILGRLLTALAPFALTLARMAAAILPRLVPVLAAAGRALVQMLGALRPIQGPLIQLAGAFGRLLAAVLPAMLGMTNATIPLVRILAAGLAPILRVLADFLSSPFAKALFTVTAIMLNPLPAALAVGKAAFQGLQAVASAVATAVVAVWNVAKAGITAVWRGIESAARTVWQAIKAAVVNPVNSAWSFLGSAWHAISGAATSAWRFLEGAASGAWRTIESAITGPVNSAWSFLSGAWHSIEGAASSAWHSVLGVARSAWNAVSSAITSPINAALRWLGNIVSWFVNAGENIVKGIWSGIAKAGGWLYNKIKDFAHGIINTFKSVIPFGSPSPLFAQYGAWMMQGLANGIAAAGPQAHAALARVAQGLRMPALTGTVGMGAGAPGAGIPAVGTTGGGGITVQGPLLHVDRLDASNPADIGRVQQALLTTARQITRAQGRRGG